MKPSPLLWIPTLSAAEEIPTAVITFIALLMFLQFGETMAMSTFYSSALFLPFALKSFVRSKVRSAGNFKMCLHIAEGLIFTLLILLEVTIRYIPQEIWLLFLLLFLISTVCAWHELLGTMYYDRMLYPRQQKVFSKTKIFASQSTVVITYGVLIMFVGFLEVIFRMSTEIKTKQMAWAMLCYIIAGGFLIFFALNFIFFKNPQVANNYHYKSMQQTLKNEIMIIDLIRQKEGAKSVIIALFFLLLPQSLLFHTRVLFLLSDKESGGLECSIPDVGFAQGTIGVLAFTIGILLGRYLLNRYGTQKMFWWMVIPLTLSPVFYLTMSQHPLPGNMLAICCMCLLTQLFFGWGLSICLPFVHFISGKRYRNTIGYLYIPVIAASMIIPMSLSGWLCTQLGFKTFFILDAATAVIAWMILIVKPLPCLTPSQPPRGEETKVTGTSTRGPSTL